MSRGVASICNSEPTRESKKFFVMQTCTNSYVLGTYVQNKFVHSTLMRNRHGQTCIWPRPPGLNQSDPERSCQRMTSEICGDVSDVVVEDSQTAVVRQTSVDSCEPVDLFCRRGVTRRVVAVDKRCVPTTSRDCSDNI